MSRDDAPAITERSSFCRKELYGTDFYYRSMFYVYAMESTKIGTLYVGFSKDPRKRLAKHNRRENISTKNGIPWKLIYLEGYLDKGDALSREKFLKSGSGRKFLKKQLKNYRQNN